MTKDKVRALLIVAVCVIVVFGSGSCGSSTEPSAGSTARTEAGPATTDIIPPAFYALPQYPGSQPAGELVIKDGVMTRSFAAPTGSPDAVLDFYGAHLDGWVNSDPPHRVGPSPEAAVRGAWQQGSATLTISSEAAPQLGQGPTVQYSLQLSP